jgi:hypothetical protein
MKRVVCFLALLVSSNSAQSMNQLCTFAKYCDTHPFIRTTASSLLAAGILGGSGYCVPEIALLATLNLNAAYDLSNLRFKKYKPAVRSEKTCIGCLALAVDTTLCFHALVG